MRRRRDFWLAHGALIGLSARVFCRRITSRNERAGSAQPPRSPPAGPGVSACLSGDRGAQPYRCSGLRALAPQLSAYFLEVCEEHATGPPASPQPCCATTAAAALSARAPRASARGAQRSAAQAPAQCGFDPRSNPKGLGRCRAGAGGPGPRGACVSVLCALYIGGVCVQVLLLRVLDSRLAIVSM